MQEIFSYTSYRNLIKDYYETRKQENSAFSYQVFAQKAGFTTKTYLIEVVSGKKPLPRTVFSIWPRP